MIIELGLQVVWRDANVTTYDNRGDGVKNMKFMWRNL